MEVILAIVGGLILFLYAVINLSDTIQSVMGEKSKEWILRFTSNTFYGIITGTVITGLLDSSSAVIIITIIFVNAQLLSFRRAMSIVLGANIGTTISSQIIAMDVSKYSPVLLVIGFLLVMVSKSPRITNTGKVVLFFGILFFGLHTMENAVEPLKSSPDFMEWLKRTESPLIGSAIGAFVTLIIQSSSATVGMAIVLTKKGLLGITGGIAIMIGAELGTCSDTLLATIRGTREALRTGVFHLLFNLISIITGLVLFYPFVNLVLYISQQSSAERTLANAHMLFNLLGVLVFVWFLPLFEKVLMKLIPDKRDV
jgi:phosphate:Na+ symporter